MATRPFFATTGVAAFRLSPDTLWRPLQTWSEELSRAFAAADRYEDLKIRQEADGPRRDRGANARQVFIEMYADA